MSVGFLHTIIDFGIVGISLVRATVPVASGSVIVLAALGVVAPFNVVSYVPPSNIIPSWLLKNLKLPYDVMSPSLLM